MTIPIFQIDAFGNGPFTGNPAAVVVLKSAAAPAWMQSVAAEMNLSETAFVVPKTTDDIDTVFDLRWFTPQAEVELCGHATLATARALQELGMLGTIPTVEFRSASGPLFAKRVGDYVDGVFELDFPESELSAVAEPHDLADALGTGLETVYSDGTDVLVELDAEETLRALSPDFLALRDMDGVRGVIVTSRAAGEADYDFVSRFFGPAVGIDEDPVTGSAHCSLAAFWSKRLGKDQMVGFQASKRGGLVAVERRTNSDGQRRVGLRGQTTVIFRGELSIQPE